MKNNEKKEKDRERKERRKGKEKEREGGREGGKEKRRTSLMFSNFHDINLLFCLYLLRAFLVAH